jgi:hypothetical protein
MLEKRFRYILKLSEEAPIEQVWREYFAIGGRRHPFDLIRDAVVARPRDVIYFVSKLFESALNANHPKADESDFQYAVEAYSNFLHQNMISETQAEFPEISVILSEVQRKYPSGWLPFQDFRQMLYRVGYSAERMKVFLDFLFSKNYLIAMVNGRERVVTDRTELITLLGQRRLLLFRKHRAKVMLNPGLHRLRSRAVGL